MWPPVGRAVLAFGPDPGNSTRLFRHRSGSLGRPRLRDHQGRNLTKREQQRRTWIVAAVAAARFTVYAAAMPSFFFQTTILTIPWGQWAAVLAIITAMRPLPTIAQALRVRK